MSYTDLRGFIDVLDRRGELRKIDGADPDLEMGALTALAASKGKSHPALLFDQIKGHSKGFRVLTNFMTTESRSRLVLGIDSDQDIGNPVEYLANKLEASTPVNPREVSDGPVFENTQKEGKVDLLKFPAPKWHTLDGGKYLGTSDVVVMKDPETKKVNLGTYRLQLHDRRTLGIAINPGHHGGIIESRYWERGLACPVAISLGHDPRIAVAANMYLPWGEEEYGYACWLRGAPVDVVAGPSTGLPVPADAEIVIEGEIPPPSVASAAEGPFGEFGGYYSVESKPQPVVRVKAVYHRNDPVALGTPPLKGVPHNGTLPMPDAILLTELRRLGHGDGLRLGRMGPFIVVAMKTRYAGHSRRVADVIASGIGSRPPKYIVLVDDDVDITSREDVLWALQTRVDAEEAVYLVRNRWGSPTDPRIPPEKKEAGDITASSLIFDATMPFAWKAAFPKTTEFSKSMLADLDKKWWSESA